MLCSMYVFSLSLTHSLILSLSGIQVVQLLWKYIKEHSLQDTTNKRVINCDAALEALLGVPSTDMFQLNVLLKPHIMTIPGTVNDFQQCTVPKRVRQHFHGKNAPYILLCIFREKMLRCVR